MAACNKGTKGIIISTTEQHFQGIHRGLAAARTQSGGEMRCRTPALNIYKSSITDLNEPFDSDLGASTMGEE